MFCFGVGFDQFKKAALNSERQHYLELCYSYTEDVVLHVKAKNSRNQSSLPSLSKYELHTSKTIFYEKATGLLLTVSNIIYYFMLV